MISFLLFFTVLGLNLIISSCNKVEEGSGFSYSDLVGMWVAVDYDNIGYYWEFTKDKHIKYYKLRKPSGAPNCFFGNGTLFYPLNSVWELTMYDEYEILDGCIFFDGINMGQIKKINKDKYLFMSNILVDGVVERINNLKAFEW